MKWSETRDRILGIPVPAREGRYCPIPHSVFLNELEEKIQKAGYIVRQERFLTNQDGKMMSGWFSISDDSDTEMCPSISFVNSYNKTRKAIIRASATVLVCKNGMMGSVDNGFYSRKHLGENALNDFRTHMSLAIQGLEEEFKRLQTNRDEMKQIEVDRQFRAKLIGDMFINEDLITPVQLGVFKRETLHSKDFKGTSAWDFYNHVTEALKENHPMQYDKQHIKFHTYMSDKLGLSGHRGLYGESILEENEDYGTETEL